MTPSSSNPLLHHLNLIYKHGDPIWLKLGTNNFYYCELDQNGSLTLFKTIGRETARKIDRSQTYDADWLVNHSVEQDGGLLYLPGKPLEFPLKGYSKGSNDLGCELDWGTREDQQSQFDRFKAASGLDPLILHSGSKSLHGHLVLNKDLSVNERNYLLRLLCIALLGDPSCAQEYQAMRLAGGFRKEKGKYQDLIAPGAKHSLEEVIEGLEKAFNDLGYIFPTTISDERWGVLSKVLRSNSLDATAKRDQIRENLAKSEDELFPKREIKPSVPGDYSNLPSSVTVPLEYFLSKENQNNLGGVSDHRNNIATALLRDLLGCADALQQIGVSHSGDAYSLFIHYCQSCPGGDGWDQREWESIWRSNSGKSFTPAITSEGVAKQLYWYRWHNDPDFQAKAKAEYRKQFHTATNTNIYTDTYTDSFIDSSVDIDLDSCCDEDDYYLNINDIPDISESDYQAQLASQNQPRISEILGLEEQLNRRNFTPDFSFSHQFLPDIYFNEDHIYAVKSPIGTGKTTVVINHINDRFEEIVQNQETLIFLGYLNSLLYQTVSKLNSKIDPVYKKQFIHINDKDNINIENDRLIALCLDSLLKIDPVKINNCTLIIDETIAVLGHLYFGTTHIRKYRPAIIKRFWELVSKAKTVILLDGNLTDWALELFHKLGNKPIIRIENTFKVEKKHPCKFLLGTEFLETEKLNKNDKRPMIKDIIDQAYEQKQINDEIKALTKAKEHESARILITKRKPFVIPCESQRFGESLEILLKSLGLKGYRLDGKTSRLNEAKDFLENPDLFIQLTQPDYLIYSPSAQSGLDISIKGYFKNRYCFFFGVSEVNIVDGFTQFIGRIRDDIPTKVWIADRAISGENLRNKINSLDELKKQLDADFAIKMSTILADEDMAIKLKITLLEEYTLAKDIHYDFALAMVQQARGEQFHLRDSTIARLKAIGTPVETYIEVLDEAILQAGGQYKVKSEERDLIDATEVYNAPEPILKDWKYETNVSETCEGYWAASVKAGIYNRLPAIQNTPVWSVDFINTIRNTNPRLIGQLTLLTKLRNPDLHLSSSKISYKYFLQNELKALWDFKDDVGIIEALRSIELLELIDQDDPFLIADDLPQKILKACRSPVIRKQLGSQGKLSDQDWLRRLVGRIGYKLSAKCIKQNGKNLYEYKITPICSEETYSTAITDCVFFKLTGLAKKNSELPWLPPSILASNEILPLESKSDEVFFPKQAETLTGYSLDAVATKGNCLKTFPSLSQPIDDDLVLPKNKEIVPPCEDVGNEDSLTKAVREIDPNSTQIRPKLQQLLDNYGVVEVAAAIEAVTPPSTKITDRRALLYQGLAEILVSSTLKYVGVSHYIKQFVNEGMVVIDDFSGHSYGGLTCKLCELPSIAPQTPL